MFYNVHNRMMKLLQLIYIVFQETFMEGEQAEKKSM